MTKTPVWRLRKDEIVWLGTHRCRHGNTYLEHYNCYLTENPNKKEKIGFLDIEASNLDANFGITLCYCIKEFGTGKIYQRLITKKEIEKDLDKEVLKQFLRDIQHFDKVVTYYGTGFDLPFLRTRCLMNGLDFPEYGEKFHKDIYYLIRSKFKLNRNRQETACRALLGKTEKTRIEYKFWIKALRGDRKSLDYILDHCKKDVKDLEKLYKKVIRFNKETKRSW
jgi:uncharacterized protein YprB with RNaseH-like and TPR domain